MGGMKSTLTCYGYSTSQQVIAVLNIGFSLLRVPLAVDLKAKTGELEEVLRRMDERRLTAQDQDQDPSRAVRRRRLRRCCCCCCRCNALLRSLWACLRTELLFIASCIKRTFSKRIAVHQNSMAATTSRSDATPAPLSVTKAGSEAALREQINLSALPLPRSRSRMGSSRKLRVQQVKKSHSVVDALVFERQEQGQQLTSAELGTIMTRVNDGQTVPDKELHALHSSTIDDRTAHHPSQSAAAVAVNVPKLKTAVTAWTWAQVEQSHVLPALELKFAANADATSVSVSLPEDLRSLLEHLNDGITPSNQELIWVLKMCPSARQHGQAIMDYAGAVLDDAGGGTVVRLNRLELQEAVKVWYRGGAERSRLNRRQLHELRRVRRELAGPARRAIAAQYSTNLHEVAQLLGKHRHRRACATIRASAHHGSGAAAVPASSAVWGYRRDGHAVSEQKQGASTQGGDGGLIELREIMSMARMMGTASQSGTERHPSTQKVAPTQLSDEDVQHVLSLADMTARELDDMAWLEPGSEVHRCVTLWLTLQRTQQRIDDCFTKYYLIELTISACKVFNEFADLADQHHLTERTKQATAAAAPDWSAERSALQHVLGQLSLPSLRDEACLAGVEPGLVDAAHVAKGSTLQRGQVHDLLTELNEGIKVSWEETDWAIETSDVDGNGELDREELRAAVSWWYIHVVRAPIRVSSGFRAALPWAFAVMAGTACTLLVALVSVGFSERKTRAWLAVSVFGLFFKLVVFDPFKALCCGSMLEPILALVSCDFSGDALIELFEDVVELYSENAHFLMGDMRDDDVQATRDEAKVLAARAAHNSVFFSGSMATKKLMAPIERKRLLAQRRQHKEHTEHLAKQLQSDADIVERRLVHIRRSSDEKYAERVAKKRRARGMSIGRCLFILLAQCL
jgi:hypothetical protein